MVTTTSQILTIVGLILEFFAFFIPAWDIFLSKESRYYRYLEERGKTIQTKLEAGKREAKILLILMFLGLLFQGLAVVLTP